MILAGEIRAENEVFVTGSISMRITLTCVTSHPPPRCYLQLVAPCRFYKTVLHLKIIRIRILPGKVLIIHQQSLQPGLLTWPGIWTSGV